MATTADDSQNAGGVKALRRLKSTDAPLYLSASPDLSEAARLASKYLYSSLKPYTPKSPFAQLLTDGFDAEQIWQQIDFQSEPLLSSLRRQIRQFEKNPEEISKLFNLVEEKKRDKEELAVEEGESEDFKDVAMDDFDDEDDVDDDDEEEEEDDDDEEGDDGEKSEDGEEENGGVKGGLEDKFFKVNQLEEYMEADEAREYGLKKKTKRTRSKDEEEEDEEADEDEDEDEVRICWFLKIEVDYV